MGIDIWEVIDAAATKPFGFMPFYPGPGLGGHCIPVDPFYLSWKAREYDFATRFIELAGEINTAMPYHVVDAVAAALNEREKSLKGSRVLVLGVAYKKDVDDLRESPSLKIIELLQQRGAAGRLQRSLLPRAPQDAPLRLFRNALGGPHAAEPGRLRLRADRHRPFRLRLRRRSSTPRNSSSTPATPRAPSPVTAKKSSAARPIFLGPTTVCRRPERGEGPRKRRGGATREGAPSGPSASRAIIARRDFLSRRTLPARFFPRRSAPREPAFCPRPALLLPATRRPLPRRIS